MSLCKELGGMTYEEMLQRMSSREVTKWIAYNELEKDDMDRRAMTNEVKSKVRG